MKQKEVFAISILIFLTVIFWVIVDIYHENAERKLQIPIEAIQPVDSDINIGIIDILKSRQP